MKHYVLPILITVLLLFACSGEAYVSASNNTPATIMVSINNMPDQVLAPGDTGDVHTVPVTRGVLNNIPIQASGEWLSEYSSHATVANGERVVHRVHPQRADINIVNTSVDSAYCIIGQQGTYLYFSGYDSLSAKYHVDGSVSLTYEGRYIFGTVIEKAWFPGDSYRFELEPDACEIQLNNIHPNRAVYYVYISPRGVTTWGDDKLGDDILYPQEAYVWKALGDVQWDMRIEAGDPHPDSALYIYEFYDEDGCPSDYTWVYEFPTIFDPVTVSKSSKTRPYAETIVKSNALNKEVLRQSSVRIESIGKKEAGLAAGQEKSKMIKFKR
jgi:hypothetical protein